MTTLRLPLVSLPIETSPSISLMIVIFRLAGPARRRGQPPVMSCTFVVARDLREDFAGVVVAFLSDDVRADAGTGLEPDAGDLLVSPVCGS